MILELIFLLFCLASVITKAEFCIACGVVIIIEVVLTVLGLILAHFCDEDFSINFSFLYVIIAMLLIFVFMY